jgi:hypothetical protein
MGVEGAQGDAPRMLNGLTHHKPALLAVPGIVLQLLTVHGLPGSSRFEQTRHYRTC